MKFKYCFIDLRKQTLVCQKNILQQSFCFHKLQDAKITNVLSLCHDKTILAAVQSIIENMIACEDDKSQQQLHFLQSCGFGGLWRFAGPFTKYVVVLLNSYTNKQQCFPFI